MMLAPPNVNWVSVQNRDSFYSLALIVEDSGLLPGSFLRNNPMEFGFNMQPQGLDMEEPAACQIVPTQNRGQFIEHQGNIFKNISIKGTTGLRPNRDRPGGVIPLSFPKQGNPAGIPANEKTGFDDLVELVNLFRMYFSLKEDVNLAPKTTMVWKNGREGEYYVVEPISFKTSRSSSSPLTTNYDISLRTIEPYRAKVLFDEMSSLFDKAGWRQRLKDYTTRLANLYAKLNGMTDSLISAGARFLTDILQPMNDLLGALTTLGETSRRVFEVPRYAIANLIDNVENARDAIEELEDFVSITPNQILRNTLNSVADQLRGIFCESQLFGSEASDRANRKIKAYEDAQVRRRFPGSDGLKSLTNGAALADINVGEDIRKVAKRLTGSASAWKGIVLLNDLKPPYISSTGDGTEVLRPGIDQILYPKSATTSATSISRQPGAKPTENTLYGRDIKLGPEIDGVRDIVLSPGGDMAKIEGVPNVVQAVEIKFDTEQGELAAHERFGLKMPIGRRGNSATSVADVNIAARDTLLSDTRIKSVNRLAMRVEGNAVFVTGDVVLIDGNDSLSLSLDVRK